MDVVKAYGAVGDRDRMGELFATVRYQPPVRSEGPPEVEDHPDEDPDERI